jgi:hypothetical protein
MGVVPPFYGQSKRVHNAIRPATQLQRHDRTGREVRHINTLMEKATWSRTDRLR